MNEQERIRIRLQAVRDLVDKLMKILDSEEERITFSDVETLLWNKFPYYYEEEVLEKLDAINRGLSERGFACRFSAEHDKIINSHDGMMQLMLVPTASQRGAVPAARETGLKEIRDFTRNAEELIIIDPYMFGGESIKSEHYINEFKKCTRIDNGSLSKVHIIYNAKDGNTKAIKTGIKKLASE